jgi:hypothetical protein
MPPNPFGWPLRFPKQPTEYDICFNTKDGSDIRIVSQGPDEAGKRQFLEVARELPHVDGLVMTGGGFGSLPWEQGHPAHTLCLQLEENFPRIVADTLCIMRLQFGLLQLNLRCPGEQVSDGT